MGYRRQLPVEGDTSVRWATLGECRVYNNLRHCDRYLGLSHSPVLEKESGCGTLVSATPITLHPYGSQPETDKRIVRCKYSSRDTYSYQYVRFSRLVLSR